MKLVISIFTGLITAFINVIIIALLVFYSENNQGEWLYAAIMIFGGIVLPIIISAFLYSLIKNKIRSPNKITLFFKQVFLILIIFSIEVFLMTISDDLTHYSDFSGITFKNLKQAFDSSYRGYVPVLIFSSFIIPFIYLSIEKKYFKLSNRRNDDAMKNQRWY